MPATDPNISLQWSEEQQRWYRLRWNPTIAQWVFLDWLPPTENRRDSHNGQRGVGNPVQGTYNFHNPVQNSHYEQLDPSFYVRDGSYFQEGRVFAILFTEAAGANALNAVTDYNTALSRVRYNEYAHTQVRRFIIVRRKREFCFAIPIFTYQGQGTKKPGVVPEEHAIAYSYGKMPQLLSDEQQLTKAAIAVVMNEGEPPLSIASRIYFGIHHPIQYNVKVKDLGCVHPDWMAAFIGYWNAENGIDTRQAADVTDQAAHSPD